MRVAFGVCFKKRPGRHMMGYSGSMRIGDERTNDNDEVRCGLCTCLPVILCM
jgi:hypothetical protein